MKGPGGAILAGPFFSYVLLRVFVSSWLRLIVLTFSGA
jgi:hypothetical protein